jgi:endonuclease/exonuclease/phosphatase (EEP) superfamily protein YafD
VHFINLHLASPHQPLELVRWRVPTAREKIGTNSLMRLVQSQIVSVYADSLGPATLLSGDFNMPAGSAIQRRCLSRFSDAFSMAGFGFGHTYYTRRVSVRIDHILCAAGWRCRGSWVGKNIGSAHRPLVADFEAMQDR